MVVSRFSRSAVTACLVVASVIPMAQAQNVSRTEVIQYHDDSATWTLGQVHKTTCVTSIPADAACDGQADSVISQTDYGWKALPWKTYSFGKLRETFSYETSATGQLGTPKTVADGNGNVTTLGNWKRGIPRLIRYPATPEATGGATQLAEVNDSGWITWITDEVGSRTCYTHDSMGRLTRITRTSEAAANTCNTSTWAATSISFAKSAGAKYGLPAGHWQQTVATGAARQITYLDALWRPVVSESFDSTSSATTSATRSVTVTRYDPANRPVFKSYAMASLSNYAASTLQGTFTTYDALGRVVQVKQDWEGTGQLTTTTAYLRNAEGPYNQLTNPRGRITRTWYRAFNEPSYDTPWRIQHDNGYAYTDLNRNIHDKLTSLVRRKGDGTYSLTRSYSYNAFQELCRAVEPETGATLMGYDGAGNLTWSASGLPASTACHATGNTTVINARKAVRSYDARNRLKTLTFPGDGLGNQTWTYWPDGLPNTVTTRNDTAGAQQTINSYTYNRRRLPTRETLKFGTVLTWPVDYVYNGSGHLASLNWHGLSVNYAPNALGQPTQAGSYATGVTYHPNGSIKTLVYGNGISHRTDQNVRQLPERIVDFRGSSLKYLDDYYDYDQNGNVLAISDALPGNHGNRTMTYDGLDRLTKVVSGNGASNPMFGTATYTYDLLDNLTRVNVTGGNQARNHYYCYNNQWRMDFVRSGSACTGTASPALVTLDYDLQGNVKKRNNRDYVFDFGNRLRSTTNPTSNYAYDGHGRRVLDQVGAGKKYTHYLQDGRLSMTGDERKGKVAEYIYLQSRLVAIRERDVATNVYTTKYHHVDALGSPVVITDQSRGELERTDYEPYGKPSNRAWRDGPAYTGHVEDAATGLSYMQQRYYDPQIGLFLSVDPVTAYEQPTVAFNRYRYANSNPYKFTDPDGQLGHVAVGGGVGAVFGGGMELYRQLKADGKVTSWKAVGVQTTKGAAVGALTAALPGSTLAFGGTATKAVVSVGNAVAVGSAGEVAAQVAMGDQVDAGAAISAGAANAVGLGVGALAAPAGRAAATTQVPGNPGFQVTSLRGQTFTVGATPTTSVTSEAVQQTVQDTAGAAAAAVADEKFKWP